MNTLEIQLDDGTMAVWRINDGQVDDIVSLIEELLGKPDIRV